MPLLDPMEFASLVPAERDAFRSPIPTRFVSSDEFLPGAQTERQRRIEALRWLETPEAAQRQFGSAAPGPADGPVKRAIFGENSARLYRYDQRAALATDRVALAKATYEREGPGRTNLRYGFVEPDRPGRA